MILIHQGIIFWCVTKKKSRTGFNSHPSPEDLELQSYTRPGLKAQEQINSLSLYFWDTAGERKEGKAGEIKRGRSFNGMLREFTWKSRAEESPWLPQKTAHQCQLIVFVSNWQIKKFDWFRAEKHSNLCQPKLGTPDFPHYYLSFLSVCLRCAESFLFFFHRKRCFLLETCTLSWKKKKN